MKLPFFRPALPLPCARRRPGWSAAAALLLASLGPTCALAELPPDAVSQALALARHSAQALAPPGARVLVLPGPLDPRLRLAPCQRVQAFLNAGTPVWGASRVGLRCVQGTSAWQIQLPVTVQVWASAPVLTDALPAGARLDPTHFQRQETDWGRAPARLPLPAEELIDRVLARPLSAGVPVRASDLKPRQWFAQGETVQIQALGPGFQISAEGQALAPGIEGQPVRVRTESGRIVVAQPVAPRRVELNL